LKLSVVGLGKLGAPMAAVFAVRGHEVLGVDLNERFVQGINAGKPPVFEPGLQELLQKTDGRLMATTDVARAVAETDVLFLIVPTPSEPGGAFSLKYVHAAAQSIGQALRQRDDYFLVVLTSTVMPGDTGGQLVPALEKASGKRCPEDFGVCYSPEFIALGSVIRDFLNPDFLLIGESDVRAGDLLCQVYHGIHDNKPGMARMAFVNAELTKLAVNTFVTTKISYANMLAQMCERLEGGNVDAVTRALGLDARIGSKYLKGSVGYGGPCFPRDNIALTSLARRLGVEAPLPEATDRINQLQVPRLAELIRDSLPEGGCAGVLGLAYKPHTNVLERATGIELAQTLVKSGVTVAVYDPCALDAARAVLGDSARYGGSANEVAREVDVLVVCTPCAEFKEFTAEDLRRSGKRVTVIDCWRMLDRKGLSEVCDYIGLGTDDVMRHAEAATRFEHPARVARTIKAA
jgi:UDPglucose 6-dehydrogenase